MRSHPSCWSKTLTQLGFNRKRRRKVKHDYLKRRSLFENLESRRMLSVAPQADFNLDGSVDQVDLVRWQAGYGLTSDAKHLQGDADQDGDVTGMDFLAWQRDVISQRASSIVVDADFNADNDVDGEDLVRWQQSYGTGTNATQDQGDADFDGDVDGLDFLAWQRNYKPPGEEVEEFMPSLGAPLTAPGATGITLPSLLAVSAMMSGGDDGVEVVEKKHEKIGGQQHVNTQYPDGYQCAGHGRACQWQLDDGLEWRRP